VRDTPFTRASGKYAACTQAGAAIMPAVPAFYHHPKTIDDLVTQYVCRVLPRSICRRKNVPLGRYADVEESRGMN